MAERMRAMARSAPNSRRRLDFLPAAERKAGSADPFEECGAPGIVAAGNHRPRDRHELCADRDTRTERRQAVAFREGNPNAPRQVLGGNVVGCKPIEHKARSPLDTLLVLHHASAQLDENGPFDMRCLTRSTRNFAAPAPARQIAAIVRIRHGAPRR